MSKCTYKIIVVGPGDRWPQWGMVEDLAYMSDLKDTLRHYCTDADAPYKDNPERWKAERKLATAGKLVVSNEGKYAVIVIEEPPEVNEWGLVVP